MPPKSNQFNKKKTKLYNSRAIRSQNSDKDFKDGILSVPQFLASREFEIKAFELSQLNTKYASSTRVFQSLPRSLRRRAASHNVKRIPKRLRNKAIREMQNSINGVPAKKHHPRGRELYRLRTTKKLLRLASKINALKSVPTAEINGKLKLRQKIKILNEQIKELEDGKTENFKEKLSNYGSCDNTGINQLAPKPRGKLKYSQRQREFVWLPTHIWHAKRFHMIKKWGYQIPLKPTQKCFKAISRASKSGCIIYEGSFNGTMIIDLKDEESMKLLIQQISKFKKKVPEQYFRGKSYDDWIYIGENKIGKGLIFADMNTKKVMLRVNPSLYTGLFEHVVELVKGQGNVNDCRYSIGSIEVHGPRSLNSLSQIFHFTEASEIKSNWIQISQHKDTSLIPAGTTFAFSIKDPRYWKHPVNPPPSNSQTSLIETIRGSSHNKIIPEAINQLFDNHQREISYENQKSLKQLGKEYSMIKATDNSIRDKEGSIPIMITKLSNDNWVVIIPWFWVLPIWYKLNEVRAVQVGGLKQIHQINLENNKSSYPTDYPFLNQGMLENHLIRQLERDVYMKKPKSKKSFDEYEYGFVNNLSCDWYFLSKLRYGLMNLSEEVKNNFEIKYASFDELNGRREIQTLRDLFVMIHKSRIENPQLEITSNPLVIYNGKNELHQNFIKQQVKIDYTKEKFPALPVIQIKLQLQTKGFITDHARIYEYTKTPTNDQFQFKNLIGFVTSGAYNLTLGKPSAVGCVSAELAKGPILIKNVGSSRFLAANWEKI
ncbi:POPLD-domain-containing protein [Hyphopichia burtonii NRRL Y-1933]|uniref:POPLD-domain-containing protein n=1 Tax=Hyphopichia burtonii NRRL Y-1933 TaxID=984485 RepID=A0A1E4RKU2_9ASCO|nr:POPLD-domain-containing protein [Hyphopichia burtonii NRRL Y-1933]ODV67850.1 POPLD-domain-containing protein [Hyphopichia burtonii NRRL Y-1933]